MADTSLVFNVLGRERVAGALSRVRSLFRSAGQEAQRATRAAATDTERLDRQIGEVERSLAGLNAEFAATGNKELFAKMKRDRSLLSQLQAVRREIGRTNDEANRLGDNDHAGNMLSRLAATSAAAGVSLSQSAGSAVMGLVSNVWTLVPALGVAAAGLMMIGPAANLAGAAIGALPAIISTAAAAMAALKLGTMGLAENWKAMTTAAGGAAGAARDMTSAHRAVEQAAKQVTRAHRDVSDAIKNVTKAELAVTEAQEDARRATLAVADAVAEERRRRGELARDMTAANLDVEEAVDSVQEAEAELNAARANGAGPEEIDDLDRAYRRAQLTLENSRLRAKELGDEQSKAANTAIGDSELVQAAKEREKDAVQRIADAEEQHQLAIRRVADARDAETDAVQRLADARKALNAPQGGGGGGGGPVTPQIAKSAQQFLNVLKELQPAFKRLQLNVQEKLFAGLGDKFRTMATAWLPQLNTTLGNFATTFNGIAKTFMTTATKKTFIDNMATGAEAGRKALDRIGQVVAGPLTTAFGQITAASAPFVEAVGEKIGRALEKFSAWIDKLSKNKKLDAFFKKAVGVLDQVGRSLGYIGSIAGSVMSILFGGDNKGKSDPFKAVADSLEKVAAWFKDPENQKKIQDFITDLKRWAGEVKALWDSVSPAIGPALAVLKFSIQSGTNNMKSLVAQIKAVGTFLKWLGDNAPKWWQKVKDAAGSAKDWIVKKWNTLLDWLGGLKSRIGKKVSGLWDGIKTSFRNTINWLISKWNGLQFTIGGGSFMGMAVPSATFDTPNIPYLAQGGIVPATPGGRLAVLGEGGRDEAVIPLDRAGGMGGGPTKVVLTLAPGADSPLMRAVVAGLRAEIREAGRGSVQKYLGQKGVAA